MNRKQFLRRGALLTLAATALPRIGRAFQETDPEQIWYTTDRIKRNEGSWLQYAMHINDDDIVGGTTSPTRIKLVITDHPHETGTGGTKGTYTLEQTGDRKTEGTATIIKLKQTGEVEGKDVMKGVLPKKITMKLEPKESVTLDMGKGKSVVLTHHVPSDTDTDECFLTTACTVARGLPDDCMELSVLRDLRDAFMKPTAEGARLISTYYQIAPGIVQRVNGLDNRNDIWRLVYDDLVVPSIELIQTGRKEEAVRHYAEYVGWMQEAFPAGAKD